MNTKGVRHKIAVTAAKILVATLPPKPAYMLREEQQNRSHKRAQQAESRVSRSCVGSIRVGKKAKKDVRKTINCIADQHEPDHGHYPVEVRCRRWYGPNGELEGVRKARTGCD